MSDYCLTQHKDTGLFCLLHPHGKEHPHVSVDNTKLDMQGRPGCPFRWGGALPDAAFGAVNPHKVAVVEPVQIPAEVLKPAAAIKPVEHTRPAFAPDPRSEAAQRARDMGFTGIPCEMCGSPNTKFDSKCLHCYNPACRHEGSCG